MATRFVTEEDLRKAVGDADVDSEFFGQVLDDARLIHDLVQDDPWLTETSLRSEAENAGIDPDRVNVALQILQSSGQLYAVNLTEKQIPAELEEAR